jgi:hypothetical protein
MAILEMDGRGSESGLLVRVGWNISTIKVGDAITASGHRPKNGSDYLRLYKVVLPERRELTGL